MDKMQLLRDKIKKGVDLLKYECQYSQSMIVKKLEKLDHDISTSSLTNIMRDKENLGDVLLIKAAQGIELLIHQELGYRYDEVTKTYLKAVAPNWQPNKVPIEDEAAMNGIKFHWEGRAPLTDKAALINQTQKELIEVGIRLNTFVDYFISHRQQLYRQPVIDLLKRGGVFKVYMLDPKSNEASIYFTDRAKVQKTEVEALNEMHRIVERLRDVAAEMQQFGAFEVYLYKHIPYNHFFVSDGYLPTGRMMISHYLYGIKRADCPVLEFGRTDNAQLFMKYFDSLQHYLKGAVRLY
jgi:hypothetical protein